MVEVDGVEADAPSLVFESSSTRSSSARTAAAAAADFDRHADVALGERDGAIFPTLPAALLRTSKRKKRETRSLWSEKKEV